MPRIIDNTFDLCSASDPGEYDGADRKSLFTIDPMIPLIETYSVFARVYCHKIGTVKATN